MTIKTPILPSKQRFAKVKNATHELNLKAICVFVATGFFLDDDTYWKDEVCLLPGHNYVLDEDNVVVDKEPWFHWHYSPQNISFDDAKNSYISLLKEITKDQVGDNTVILPLSGGLDSRSQALILKDLDNDVSAFSYSFKNGYPEHKISKQIAEVCGFKFLPLEIPEGYLWNSIDELAHINNCYSEFTNPRQMAVFSELKRMNGVFSLGHWGDVFFDRGAPKHTKQDDIIDLLYKKMVKKYGLELAEKLWQSWELEGDFKSYLTSRLEDALSKIKIDNVSAKVRAFKTSQWAHRWTTTNLSIFEAAHPITLPFYDDRMCEFICSIPEEFLADRKLQLAHLKDNKAISAITWHAQRPFNLYNYHKNKSPFNMPFRIKSKVSRELNKLKGQPFVQRNWELQFVGNENESQLKSRLYSKSFNQFVPKQIVDDMHTKFMYKDSIHYAHPLSMLLTLSLWNQHFNIS